MPGFKLYLSNRLEILIEQLASVVGKKLSSFFKQEIIVVQSKGMERWLSMELAKKFRIWSNCIYPFPDNFIWEIFKIVLKDTPNINFFDPSILSWRIMNILPDLIDKPSFHQIKDYIGEDKTQLKTFQLSERIAHVFDRYTVYRPDIIIQWDKENQTDDWQQSLWKALTEGKDDRDRAHMLHRFEQEIQKNKFYKKDLPERISIFGISALPLYHLRVIQAISHFIDIHFFFLSPTCEYWGDIIPERKLKTASSDMHFETGNPLLASMGKMGRDFFNIIIEDAEEYHLFEEPDETNLLTKVQSDIFHLRWRGRNEQKSIIEDDDISIQVHSCHSPIREIEVLYNNLLFFFETYKDLKPKDIIVMTPDIETYAPFISAVFDGYGDETKKIPYSIADRGAIIESPTINSFLKILNLCNGRFYASHVLDILDDPNIREKFNINNKDMDTILKWINDTNIRWGVDEIHRESMGISRFKNNSWQAGIERLLLGYSMFSKDEEIFNGILPYNDIEGDDIDTLNKLLDFLIPLFDYSKKLPSQNTLDGWSELLKGILETFMVVNDETQRDIQLIRDTIKNLEMIKSSLGMDKTISVQVIIHYLKNKLNTREFSTGFITGGVTFCEMLPMRSIPFKIVALIGMNNDAYPREYRPLGFDLIAQFPRKNDRSLRDEDRYLFLESILSARKCLYISYVGQSIKDNSTIPPSVVVSELLDYIEKGFYHPEKNPLNIIVKKHPLQGFSPRYFQKDNNLFSYSEEDCEAITAKIYQTYNDMPFISIPLKEPTNDLKDITNQDLKRFFSHPVKFFLNNRLGIFLDDKEASVKDDEPFELDNLEKYTIRSKLIEKMVSYTGAEKTKEIIYARGMLPPKTLGKVSLDYISKEVEGFFKKIEGYISDKREPIDFHIEINGFKINVRINDLYKYGIVRYRGSNNLRARDLLELWIDHVLLSLYQPEKAIILSMNEIYSFRQVDKSNEIIKKLLEIYQEGMKMPIRFFPEISFAYAKNLKKNGNESSALSSARNKWENQYYENQKSIDLYYRFYFGESEPFDKIFCELAKTIFYPLLEYGISESQ
ncbi:MAG TPA: exodeoxyribonuclease V subunit gamma [Syntrophorhabdaceae bacterium]|nr:exodeoxyribonuclease V subunit gamma [Syntrophorhabdaceae bacterium]